MYATNLFANNSRFINCQAAIGGGAFAQTLASLLNSSFDNCLSDDLAFAGGGALWAGALVADGTAFTNSSATMNGGCLFVNGHANITGSLFSNCTSARDGGGLYAQGLLRVSATHFVHCTADTAGGAYLYDTGMLTDTTFVSCVGLFELLI